MYTNKVIERKDILIFIIKNNDLQYSRDENILFMLTQCNAFLYIQCSIVVSYSTV